MQRKILSRLAEGRAWRGSWPASAYGLRSAERAPLSSDARGGKHARHAREVARRAGARPRGSFDERPHRVERIVAQLEHQVAAACEQLSGLRDKRGVEIEAAFAREERRGGLMLPNLARQRCRLAAGDVRRIADDEMKRAWLLMGDARLAKKIVKEIALQEPDAGGDAVARGVALRDGQRCG